ncbi:ABC transporter ATP-binding protein [Dictyobacter kobayashii]|uniref:Bacitracin ABC transporter ATP-binding protein BcrA n=1 Tax=Dictyobacter kobayashii TaxID=2014872 RepID=A0A402AT84_9CHLR|nr:ATP-binding cassette domain-containing protein [Dictyobacter kobayashii]GCE22301.1 bacitracin ABC transporter ATP-binding protein BcrA [Dictyobacter kobayashii]
MASDVVVNVSHVKKYYKAVRAVEDISLQVRSGEIFGFLGPNGSGKTTTIGMMLGLIYPTAGSVEIFGQQITPMHNAGLVRVGTLMGSPSMMMAYSARRNLQMLHRLYPDVPLQRIDQVLEMVGLSDVNNRPVKQFSTGMKQRLGLALALLGKPDLLILDEPTNGMDPVGMHEIRLLLQDLARQGVTIFISSHLLHEMQLICNRVAIVGKGLVVAEGRVEDLLKTDLITRVKTSNPEKAMQVLAEIVDDKKYLHVNGPYLDVQAVTAEKIIEQLVSHSLTPSEVFPIQNNLENVFLRLAQQTDKGVETHAVESATVRER